MARPAVALRISIIGRGCVASRRFPICRGAHEPKAKQQQASQAQCKGPCIYSLSSRRIKMMVVHHIHLPATWPQTACIHLQCGVDANCLKYLDWRVAMREASLLPCQSTRSLNLVFDVDASMSHLSCVRIVSSMSLLQCVPI